MSASNTDKITDVRNAARPVSTTASGSRNAGGTSLACNSLTGWPTASKVHFVTYQIDANSNPVAGTQLDCYGIVSGTTIGSLVVVDGTDNGNSIGDVVEMLPTAAWGQDLADALTTEHNRLGVHNSTAAITIGKLLYPVGSIYINYSDSTNPGSLLGFGTWSAFGGGRVPVGVGTSDAVYAAAATGGESTHTLTTAEMPAHTHANSTPYNNSDGATTGAANMVRLNATANQNFPSTDSTGGGGSHNNLQPYITVYMWRRTA